MVIINVIVDKELYKKLHYEEGSNICPNCGRLISGGTSKKGFFFFFKEGCPNKAHELWKKTEEMIRKDV